MWPFFLIFSVYTTFHKPHPSSVTIKYQFFVISLSFYFPQTFFKGLIKSIWALIWVHMTFEKMLFFYKLHKKMCDSGSITKFSMRISFICQFIQDENMNDAQWTARQYNWFLIIKRYLTVFYELSESQYLMNTRYHRANKIGNY